MTKKNNTSKQFIRIELYTDGGARGNPGPAGAGAVLKDMDGNVIDTVTKYLGETTNNQAEYHALILGLKRAKALGVKEVDVFMDSQLAVKQINGEYKVKNEEIAKRFVEVANVRQFFTRVRFTHIRRERNTEADALVNEIIDAHVG